MSIQDLEYTDRRTFQLTNEGTISFEEFWEELDCNNNCVDCKDFVVLGFSKTIESGEVLNIDLVINKENQLTVDRQEFYQGQMNLLKTLFTNLENKT